ncbi:MAG: hypothetical protein R3C14_04485 [Caldilineaceae bacterium]
MIALALPIALLCLLCAMLLAGCNKADAQTLPSQATIPQFIATIDDEFYVERTAVHPNGQIYFLSESHVSIVDGTAVATRIAFPKPADSYGQHMADVAVERHSGLVYTIERYADAIYVISNTQLITTILGQVDQPLQIVADEDSGEMYVFYTSQKGDKAQAQAAILSAADVITDIVLPVFSNRTARYNPVDGHIYVVGSSSPIPTDRRIPPNALTVIDNREVITTITPLDKPDLSVIDLTINPNTGDVYILLATKVVYWDRHNPPRSIDLYALGYKNLGCITVDPKRGWAYVCSWPGRPSYMLVVDKDQFVGAIEVEHWPYAAAADATHDYIYVAHYDPTYLSVIRATDLITTLDIIGLGTMNVTVDEERELIYTSNAGDGTISVFGFQPLADQPSLWQSFLPFLQR